jgi:adenylate cyclase
MREDEEATVRDIAAHRVLIAEIIQQHHGRVIDSPGDNILAEFASVVDAVNGAIKIQEEIKKGNASIAEDRRMEFRIGINLGDVIEEEERIYGDGVNIAARVEGLAAAGGISISGTVYEHIKDKLSLGYNYLGEQDVKNIPEPVRVYRLLTEPKDAGKMIGEEKFKSRKFRYIAFGALSLVILVAGVLVFWNNYFRVKIEPAAADKMAFPLPDKPSIAVLPFENMSDDPQQEYFSDGITEDIITAISKTPKLFVIDRNSSFTYKGKPVKVQEVGRDLGVRYVLEGSVRKAGETTRISVQLIDAKTGHPLWADKYDRDKKDIFALQDEITMRIITALQVKLTEGEQAAIRAKGTDNLEVYLKVLEARDLARHHNMENNLKARQLLKEALDLDPNYAVAYRLLASTHASAVWLGSSKSPEESLKKAIELCKKALSIDNSLGDAHALLGAIYVQKKQYDKGILEFEKAIELNPNGADSHQRLARGLAYIDKTDEAILILKKAIRLNPKPSSFYFYNLATFYRNIKNYEEALVWAEKAVKQEPQNVVARWVLCSIYSLLGRMEEARIEANEVMKLYPKFSLKRFEKRLPYQNPEVKKRLIDALSKAGLK